MSVFTFNILPTDFSVYKGINLIRKIDELKLKLEKAEELLNLYKHDKLTGLLGRRDFDNKFSEFFESKKLFYLILVDVNGLHNVNSNPKLGYEAGDELICSVAHKLSNIYDTIVYRIGGDEFAILSFNPPINKNLDNNYTCAILSSKSFNTIRSMVKGVDAELIKAKTKFYKTYGGQERRKR